MLHKERYAFFRKKPKVSFAPWREPLVRATLGSMGFALCLCNTNAKLAINRKINKNLRRRTHMKYKGTLIAVKDCSRALKFYRDMFGFQLLQDNDGNMELTNNLYLQESGYWEQFIERSVIPNSNQSELYFEEPNIEQFVERLETLYPEIEYVNHLMTHSWGQKVVRFYDLDGNLIEVGTPL